MKISSLIRQVLLAGAGTLLLLCVPVLADEAKPMPAGDMSEHSRSFDWIEHTRSTLAELKVKLNLSSKQLPPWEDWSDGVIKDAHQQLQSKNELGEEKESGINAPADAATPELMARGIRRLHAEVDWMQQHLIQLEAAQVRTKAFYDTLDINQKTIFDLFWHEMYHRSAGHDEGHGTDEIGGFGPGGMMGHRRGPAGGTEPN